MRKFLEIAAVSCALVLVVGCQSAPFATTSTETETSPGVALQGRVHGGQQPISGASVYLYAVSTTGYGAASTSLLQSPGYVTTDSNGNFSINSDYTCASGAEVYIYSVSGNPGLASGTNNTAAGLMAGLGSCSGLSSTSFITVNEVSTVATAYALAGYATDATHISSSGSTPAATGVANAFASITNLETLSTGVALATTPAGNGTVPQIETNMLANVLAACVNTTGPGSTPCTTLFSNAMNGSTAPTDTATAAINIAHNPEANIANLFGLESASAPFQPSLSVQPNDFTLAINYTGGGLDNPREDAIDSSGNVWVANYYGQSVSKFSPTGAALSPSTGFTGGGLDYPASVAVDGSGNVWVANTQSDSISKFSSTGEAVSDSSGYTGGGLNGPGLLAIDKSGNIWVDNRDGNDIAVFNSSGMAVSSSSGIAGGGLNDPLGIAIDASGDIWVADNNGNQISEFSSVGVAISGAGGITGGGLNGPVGIAIDGSGNAWTGSENNTLNEFNSNDSPLSGSRGYTGGGLDSPYYIAIDAASNVFVPNYSGNSISEFNSAGSAISGSSGYTGTNSGLSAPLYIAVDASGNVWATNTANNSVSEFVGAATPVVTPVVANLQAPYGSSAVNLP